MVLSAERGRHLSYSSFFLIDSDDECHLPVHEQLEADTQPLPVSTFSDGEPDEEPLPPSSLPDLLEMSVAELLLSLSAGSSVSSYRRTVRTRGGNCGRVQSIRGGLVKGNIARQLPKRKSESIGPSKAKTRRAFKRGKKDFDKQAELNGTIMDDCTGSSPLPVHQV